MAPTLSPAELAAHADFLRRLAGALVRDAATAEDAVQETLLQALAHPPRHGPTTRAWLSTVLRNTLRRGWRGEGRRRRHEARRAASPIEPEAAPPERLARLEQADALLRALRNLSPEKRDVIELRYFEALPPRTIAARLGIPVETVKTRLKRARSEMRSRLEEMQGTHWRHHLALVFGLREGSLPAVAHSIGSAYLMSKSIQWCLLVFAFLLLGGAAWWWGGTWTPGGEGADADVHVADRPAGTDALAGQAQAPRLRAQEGRPEGVTTTQRPSSSAAGARTSESGRRLIGQVELGSGGDRALVAQGEVRVRLWSSRSGYNEISVPHVGGRFELVVPAGETPEFVAVGLSGRGARVLEPQERVASWTQDPLVLKVELAQPFRIHAIDAETKQPLRTVYVESAGRDGGGPGRSAGRLSESAAPSASPVLHYPSAEELGWPEASYRVSSPGYTWTDLSARPLEGGARFVELWRAGRLELHVEGPEAPPGAVVRVRRTHESGHHVARATDPLVPGETLRMEGLRPGAWLARVEIGPYYHDGAVLGETAFRIEVDTGTRATLTYAARPDVKRVPLSGIVRVPEGWDLGKLAMSLEFLGAPVLTTPIERRHLKPGKGLTPLEDHPRSFRFDAGSAEPGRLLVHFWHYHYWTGVEVPAEGTESLELSLPAPAPVRVTTVLEGGEDLPPPEGLTWHFDLVAGMTMYSSATVKRTQPTEPFTFLAPLGVIRAKVVSDHWHAPLQRIEVTPAGVEATISLRPTARIRVTARDAGSDLHWSWDWTCKVEAVEHEGHVISSGGRAEAHEVRVSRAGRYRVQLGEIPGFLPAEPVEVDVTTGDPVPVAVTLTRRP